MAEDEAPQPRVVNVTGCSRCGGEHREVKFLPFVKPPSYLGLTWTHWAICPETGDPVMLRPAEPARSEATS